MKTTPEKRKGHVQNGDPNSPTAARKFPVLSPKKKDHVIHINDDGINDDEDDDSINGDYDESSEINGTAHIKSNSYGNIEDVKVGDCWGSRLECSKAGVHRPTMLGIHAGPLGAYSIVLSSVHRDNFDDGNTFTYTGCSRPRLRKRYPGPKSRTGPHLHDQTLDGPNGALVISVATGKPVRVVRGSKSSKRFAPEFGYRYDGLYKVQKYWKAKGSAGKVVYKYSLKRCAHQDSPQWLSSKLDLRDVNEDKKEHKSVRLSDRQSRFELKNAKLNPYVKLGSKIAVKNRKDSSPNGKFVRSCYINNNNEESNNSLEKYKTSPVRTRVNGCNALLKVEKIALTRNTSHRLLKTRNSINKEQVTTAKSNNVAINSKTVLATNTKLDEAKTVGITDLKSHSCSDVITKSRQRNLRSLSRSKESSVKTANNPESNNSRGASRLKSPTEMIASMIASSCNDCATFIEAIYRGPATSPVPVVKLAPPKSPNSGRVSPTNNDVSLSKSPARMIASNQKTESSKSGGSSLVISNKRRKLLGNVQRKLSTSFKESEKGKVPGSTSSDTELPDSNIVQSSLSTSSDISYNNSSNDFNVLTRFDDSASNGRKRSYSPDEFGKLCDELCNDLPKAEEKRIRFSFEGCPDKAPLPSPPTNTTRMPRKSSLVRRSKDGQKNVSDNTYSKYLEMWAKEINCGVIERDWLGWDDDDSGVFKGWTEADVMKARKYSASFADFMFDSELEEEGWAGWESVPCRSLILNGFLLEEISRQSILDTADSDSEGFRGFEIVD